MPLDVAVLVPLSTLKKPELGRESLTPFSENEHLRKRLPRDLLR